MKSAFIILIVVLAVTGGVNVKMQPQNMVQTEIFCDNKIYDKYDFSEYNNLDQVVSWYIEYDLFRNFLQKPSVDYLQNNMKMKTTCYLSEGSNDKLWFEYRNKQGTYPKDYFDEENQFWRFGMIGLYRKQVEDLILEDKLSTTLKKYGVENGKILNLGFIELDTSYTFNDVLVLWIQTDTENYIIEYTFDNDYESQSYDDIKITYKTFTTDEFLNYMELYNG